MTVGLAWEHAGHADEPPHRASTIARRPAGNRAPGSPGHAGELLAHGRRSKSTSPTGWIASRQSSSPLYRWQGYSTAALRTRAERPPTKGPEGVGAIERALLGGALARVHREVWRREGVAVLTEGLSGVTLSTRSVWRLQRVG
jgi:hypothetical protein